MRRSLLLSLPLLPLLACGGEEKPPPPGRTIDSSCGLDCEAQQRYGLTFHRCFEYTDTPQAQDFVPLAVHVLPQLAELEGGVKALEVEYLTTGGIRKMTDYFLFDDLDLKLVRRKLAGNTAQSVNYQDASGKLVGVTLLTGDVLAGDTLESSVKAQVNQGDSGEVVDTTFRVTVKETTDSEKTVPEGTHADALRLNLSETPDHAPDPVRIFVPSLGFTRIDTRLNFSTESAKTYLLQRARDVATGGDDFCGRAE